MQDITAGQLFSGRRFFVITHDGERMALRALGEARSTAKGTRVKVVRLGSQDEFWFNVADANKMFIA